MNWRDELLNNVAAAIPCGYELRGSPATEPTCWAAIALSLCGRKEQSLEVIQWLSSLQNDDGSFGPTASLESPGWPTALAILANIYFGRSGSNDVLGLGDDSDRAKNDDLRFPVPPHVRRAVEWLINAKGDALERRPDMGHDSTLVGWPWVLGTHSWVEPTALAVLGLKAAGEADHSRTREAVRLLRDRLLPEGGCNYGNTTVLGQKLRPHLQPTALALLALHGEHDDDGRIARSLDYLQSAINADTATASMAYALVALGRYGRPAPQSQTWLAAAARRSATQNSPYRMALLLLASATATGQSARRAIESTKT